MCVYGDSRYSNQIFMLWLHSYSCNIYLPNPLSHAEWDNLLLYRGKEEIDSEIELIIY